MNSYIAGIMFKVGELLQKVDWLDAGVTFISVFLGALFAYKFSLKLEMRKAQRLMRGNFCTLSTQMIWNLDEMLEYKRLFLDKIKAAYEKNNTEIMSTAIRGPMVSFEFDIDKYIFLNDCNRCFIPELKIIQTSYKSLKALWNNYTQHLFAIKQQQLNKSDEIWREMEKEFLIGYDVYTKLCIRLHYLKKHFNRCYDRFFNVFFYDDMEEDFKAEEALMQSIPNALSEEEFIRLDEYFNRFWAPDHTLWESVKFHYRKWKYRLKKLNIYFFGKGK